MVKRMFNVTAHWDEDAKVIEAATIEEFEASWWTWRRGR